MYSSCIKFAMSHMRLEIWLIPGDEVIRIWETETVNAKYTKFVKFSKILCWIVSSNQLISGLLVHSGLRRLDFTIVTKFSKLCLLSKIERLTTNTVKYQLHDTHADMTLNILMPPSLPYLIGRNFVCSSIPQDHYSGVLSCFKLYPCSLLHSWLEYWWEHPIFSF